MIYSQHYTKVIKNWVFYFYFFIYRKMYSCVKLIEDGQKKIMTVPTKWVMEGVLYWPQNKFLEGKLFKSYTDPQEDWLQIQIENELFQGLFTFLLKHFKKQNLIVLMIYSLMFL